MIDYFDSSLLMAILLEEDNRHEAKDIWESNEIKVSSILLRIETNISLLRFYNRQEGKFNGTWLSEKKEKLSEFLGEIFFTDITDNFANFMACNDSLAKCKSLDAIHLATALKAQNNPNNGNIRICSFDKNMLTAAKELGFETNPVNP